MKTHILKIIGFCSALLFFFSFNINSQVLISKTTGSPDLSAMLEVKSTSSGLLIPRMRTADRLHIDNGSGSPTEGLLVFDIDDDSFYIFGNGEWKNLSMSAEIWSKSSSNVFLTDAEDNVGIGTSSPGSKLVIQANAGAGDDDILFKILNSSGEPVFEVTSAGVRVYVMDAASAATGGFAVGEYNTLKNKGITPCFSTDPDSTRVYSANATTGGFAVGEYNTLKAAGDNYMFMVPENYFIGHQSGQLLQSGNYTGLYNTFFGYQAGLNDTSGVNNVFIGYQAGLHNTDGKYNCFIGYQAGLNNIGVIGQDYGHYNSFFGQQAGLCNSSGYFNTFIGQLSGYSNTSGYANTFVGNGSGYYTTTGIRNTIIGSGTGLYNRGSYNTFMGSWTARFSQYGNNNCLLGFSSGQYNNNGSQNTYLGSHSGERNQNGNRNVLIGYRAAYTDAYTTFSDRLYIANGATEDSTLIYGEFDNHVVGINTLSPLANIHIVGADTLGSVIIAPDETGNGDDACLILAEGAGNPYSMSLYYDGGMNKLYVYGKANTATYGPHLSINRDNGYTGIGTTGPTERLDVDGNARFRLIGSGAHTGYLSYTTTGVLTTTTSDIRLKTDIEPVSGTLEKILMLQGVKFCWKNDSLKSKRIGFIAQDMEKVFPELVFTNPHDGYMGVNYPEISVVLTEAIKEQQQIIEDLRSEMNNLKKQISDLKKLISK